MEGHHESDETEEPPESSLLIFGQCGCGEPIEMVNGSWQHLRRVLERSHRAAEQLRLFTNQCATQEDDT